jgi:hypothetical protein
LLLPKARLHTLNIGSCSFGSVDLHSLARSLDPSSSTVSPSLTTLKLNDNGITGLIPAPCTPHTHTHARTHASTHTHAHAHAHAHTHTCARTLISSARTHIHRCMHTAQIRNSFFPPPWSTLTRNCGDFLGFRQGRDCTRTRTEEQFNSAEPRPQRKRDRGCRGQGAG